MREVIQKVYADHPKHSNVMVMIAYFKGEPIGWAWSFQKIDEDTSSLKYLAFVLFIQSKHRRKGIGTKLLKWGKSVARQRHQRMVVFPWDYRSTSFFGSNESNIKEDNMREWL